jgi:type I restriction enzyme, S subunit
MPLFAGPGVIIGRKGMGHLGVEWSDRDFWVIDTAYALEPLCDIDMRFAYYLVRYVGLDHLKHGTSNPSLTREAFGAQYFPVPPLRHQRGIAATLGALDDKIESNRRAIDLTQELSRSTYAAWRAVHADSQETTFGEFADVFGGATPKTTEPGYWNGDIAWATPTDITALSAPYLFGTARMITEAGLASTSATLHPEGTIFMTSRATIGSFAVTQCPAATNQGFIAVRPHQPAHRWFLFEEMRARVPEMLDRANGSTFMELSRGNFKLMSLAVPDEAAVAELDSVLAPLHRKAAQLDRESSRLAKVRDTLLPELLSGRIRVPEAVDGAIA